MKSLPLTLAGFTPTVRVILCGFLALALIPGLTSCSLSGTSSTAAGGTSSTTSTATGTTTTKAASGTSSVANSLAQFGEAALQASEGALNKAFTFANEMQQANNGDLLPPAVVTTALSLSHNTGDATAASALNLLLGQMVGAVAVSKSQGLSTTKTQANVNAVLSPSNVAATVNQASTVAASVPASN